jgi:hypothetical protein
VRYSAIHPLNMGGTPTVRMHLIPENSVPLQEAGSGNTKNHLSGETMTFRATLRIAAVAFAATCAATTTWAVPMASASLDLGSLRYSFTDNDASDGVDASIEFQYGSTIAET